MSERWEKLFARAEAILAGRANGLGMPLLRHLAFRGYGPAMLSLSGYETSQGTRTELGRICLSHSPAGLTYRAYRQGERNAAQNMAMSLFNIGDMAGYRRWLYKAARAGDTDAASELKLFETRQPHRLARRLGRLRPYRRDGS